MAMMEPIWPGQLPPGLPRPSVWAGGDSARFQVTSYQKPVVTGEPPVRSAASPGNESDGEEVWLFVKVMPCSLSSARVEFG